MEERVIRLANSTWFLHKSPDKVGCQSSFKFGLIEFLNQFGKEHYVKWHLKGD